MQTSSLHVFDPKDRVLVTCVGVFYTGRYRKMVCARCRRDILTRLDVRGKFGRYSMYGGHLDANRCTGDILRDSMYGVQLDAT